MPKRSAAGITALIFHWVFFFACFYHFWSIPSKFDLESWGVFIILGMFVQRHMYSIAFQKVGLPPCLSQITQYTGMVGNHE